METATERAEVMNEQGQTDEVAVENEEQVEVERLEMTKEEYESALQKEADRRVAQAIKKREAEYKKELEKETAKARKEAEELAKLSESERMKVEKEREELTISKQREELTKERSEFERERLMLQAEKELAIRSLNPGAAKWVLGADAEETLENILEYEEFHQKDVERDVNERLRSKTPRLGTSNKKSYFTKEQVEKMSTSEVTANLPEIEESMKNW